MAVRMCVFDLDDTLAPSKSPLPRVMGERLRDLLGVCDVAIISGGRFEQFSAQVLDHLPPGARLERLHLLPTCGTRYLRYRGGAWREVYVENLSERERARSIRALRAGAEGLGLWEARTWGQVIEDRGTQVTFSALGQRAPLAEKRAWDPTGAKKRALREAVARELPDLEVRSGGTTSVDVTRRGIDKAYGMRRLAERTGIPREQMLFVGDRLDPAGNDYPVRAAGWPCREVDGWEQTARVIEDIVAAAVA